MSIKSLLEGSTPAVRLVLAFKLEELTIERVPVGTVPSTLERLRCNYLWLPPKEEMSGLGEWRRCYTPCMLVLCMYVHNIDL